MAPTYIIVMQRETLRTLMKVRGLSQADVARIAEVSRQAVSQWLQGDPDQTIPLRSQNLLRLCKSLGVKWEHALAPVVLQAQEQRGLETLLLWDRLYPDLIDLIAGLLRGEPKGLARLVEVFGPYKAAKILGKSGRNIWRDFSKYERYLPPVRRAEIGNLCKNQENQGWT